MTTQIDYPDCAINLKSGTNINTLDSTGLSITNTSTNTLELSPASLNIVNIPNNNHVEISDDTISHYKTGSLNTFFINQDGFVATDASGNSNGVYLGTLTTSNANGTYLNINYSQGININGNAGSEGQALKKDASNNMIWATGIADWVGTATTNLNMSSYSINNVSSINAISATNMNINGQAVFNTPPHLPEPILSNDGATKGYVDSLVASYGLLAGSNTWSGIQNFTGATLTALTQATNTNSTLVATTKWVNDFFALASSLASYGLLAGSNTWTGTQNFTGATLTAPTQATNTNSTLVATTKWVNDFFALASSLASYALLAGSNTWTGTQNFTTATLTALTQATNTNSTLVATTKWVNDFFALASSLASYGLLAGSNTWTGTQNFTGATLTATGIDGSTLSLGTTTSTTTTLGRTSNTATKINGGSIDISGNTTITGTTSVSSTFTNNTIQTSLSSSNASLWNNNITGTLGIINNAGRTGIVNMLKSTEDNYLNIGSKTGTTKGLRYVIDGYDLYFITLTNTFQNGITCPSLNSNDPLTIGTSLTSQGVTIGGNGNNTIINGLSTIIEGQLTNNNIVGIDTSTTVNAWNNVSSGTINILTGNLTGAVNILTGATRSATTLMLTGTTANTFRIGSGSSGLTFIVRGLETTLTSATTTISSATTTISSATTTISSATTNFTGTTNSFTNAIKGSGTDNLLVSAPIQPSSLTYSATGTVANAIGQIISNGLTPAQDITTGSVTALNNLTFQITAGVWLITASISCINQNASAQTYSRIITNIGSGLTGNTNSNIVINTDTNVLLSTVTAGSQKIGNTSAIFSTSASTFISVSMQVSTPTALLPLRFQTASILSAVRIA